MGKVTDMGEFRRAKEPEDPLAGMIVWFCGCGSDEMHVSETGAIYCVKCATLMEGIQAFELNPDPKPD